MHSLSFTSQLLSNASSLFVVVSHQDEKTSDSMREYLERSNQRLSEEKKNIIEQLNTIMDERKIVAEAMKNISGKMQGAPQTSAAPTNVFDSAVEWVEKVYGRNGDPSTVWWTCDRLTEI